MVFQNTGAIPSSNMDHVGRAYSLTSSNEVVVTAAAAAAITFLPILTVLFLVVPHGNEEPIKELAKVFETDGLELELVAIGFVETWGCGEI